MGAEIMVFKGRSREIRRVPDVLAFLLPVRLPLPVKLLLLPIVVVLVCHPILLALTAGGISAYSGYRVGCRWWSLFCSWCFWIAPAGFSLLLNTVAICVLSSGPLMTRHQRCFPETTQQLRKLMLAEPLGWDAGGEQQIRDAASQHLQRWAGAKTSDLRARIHWLLQYRAWLSGTAELASQTEERLRLADEGWKSGDYRNSQLLYGSVLPLLEAEIRCFCAGGSRFGRLKQLSATQLESRSRAAGVFE